MFAAPSGGLLRAGASRSPVLSQSSSLIEHSLSNPLRSAPHLAERVIAIGAEIRRRNERAARNPRHRAAHTDHHRSKRRSIACLDTDEADPAEADQLSGESEPACLSQTSYRARPSLPHSRAAVERARAGLPVLFERSGSLETSKTLTLQSLARLCSPRAPPRTPILASV
ncbi:MAG: hypothetical protein GC160_14025 [Acidobacteria bacterium]|nr:hypothetical protein [Acidobacteriota bacterium]